MIVTVIIVNYLIGVIIAIRPVARSLNIDADDELMDIGAVVFISLAWPIVIPGSAIAWLARWFLRGMQQHEHE
jgi:hypothetical protein